MNKLDTLMIGLIAGVVIASGAIKLTQQARVAEVAPVVNQVQEPKADYTLQDLVQNLYANFNTFTMHEDGSYEGNIHDSGQYIQGCLVGALCDDNTNYKLEEN